MFRISGKKSSYKLLIMVLLVIMSGIITGCGSNNEDDGRLDVAVTIEVEKGLVRAVAGDLVDIVTLVPKGGSPETYEASPMDVQRFTEADVFFAMDLPVENSKNIPKDSDFDVVNLGAAVREVYEDRYFAPGSRDHHIWLSPKRVRVMVEKIADVLIEMDPVNEEVYEKNRDDYIRELESLDVKIKEMFKDRQGQSFIVYHPAFGYFADDYGLRMYALEEEGKEADPSHIIELVDYAKKMSIKKIITTEEVSSRQVEAFAEEIDGRLYVVEILSSDYIGAMSEMADVIGR